MKTPIQARNASAGEQGIGQAGRCVGQLLNLAAIDRLHDCVAGGEVPVERADPNASAARDLVEGRLRPHFRKRRLGRLEQTVAVALGVGAGLATVARRLRSAGAFPPPARRERLVTSALKFRVSSC